MTTPTLLDVEFRYELTRDEADAPLQMRKLFQSAAGVPQWTEWQDVPSVWRAPRGEHDEES